MSAEEFGLRGLKRVFDDFSSDFAGAPVGWIALGLLAIIVAGQWSAEGELTQACGLLIEQSASFEVPDFPQQEIAATCMRPLPGT